MPDVEIIHANHQGANVTLVADQARIQVLDPYKVIFLADATIPIVTEAEDIDIPGATKNGDGVITYAINGTPITTRTTFAVGDRLEVTCAGMTTTTTVRIPRLPIA